MGARKYFRHFLGLKILGLSFLWVDEKSIQMSIPILNFIECSPLGNKHLFIDQYGFRNLQSVVSCFLNCTNDWYVNIDKGKFTAMIFIDLKKAFDTVDHQILLNKMHNYGIDGLEHQWFSSYLDNCRQFCKVKGVCSDPADISIGVPQGSCLRPLLFLIYISDLPFALKRAKATMYADDTAIRSLPII